MANYEIPEWLRAELSPETLSHLTNIAGEKRAEAVVSPADALIHAINTVVTGVKSGNAPEVAAFDAAVRAFREVAYPSTRAARAATNGAATPAAKRDSQREVALWKACSAVAKAAGFESISAAKSAGFNTAGVRDAANKLYDAGNLNVEELTAQFVS